MTEYRLIGGDAVLNMAMERRALGDRLVQIHCSHGENWEMVYSFDGSEGFVHYKVLSKEKLELKSISDFFPGAYLYENEICELFGIKIEGMSVDFKGMLYNPQREAPFNLAACETCSVGAPTKPSARPPVGGSMEASKAQGGAPTGADLSSGLGANAPSAERVSPGKKAMEEEVAALAAVTQAARAAEAASDGAASKEKADV